ncbi:MAG: hypothetical protein OEQ18_15410 [Gammaproteobacteria bacterium]|nr:hypothetical protein [Gammaproteobacteria bacterium]
MLNKCVVGKLRLIRLIFLSNALMLASVARADGLIDPFIGRYEGQAKFLDAGAEVERDLSVDISKTKEGFNLTWKAVTLKANGELKTKEYSIDFVVTRRPNVFTSAMKKNVFGGREPLDPMQGEPYVWGRITGDTLTIFALLINDDGGYELQVYDRTLVAEGLDLEYSRIRDGQHLKTIHTQLSRR